MTTGENHRSAAQALVLVSALTRSAGEGITQMSAAPSTCCNAHTVLKATQPQATDSWRKS